MIHINGLHKRYGAHHALRDLSLKVAAGEVYGLLGPNGAGKSTTIRILLGFEPFEEGSVQVGGHSVRDQAEAARRITGYIPENVELYPYLSGLENLDHFARLSGAALGKDGLREALLKCGLDGSHHNKRLSTYSKGMRQKVGIAIALARKAQVLLLDEPASGLDPAASRELGLLLRELAQGGTTVLMASHDLFRVRETCDRVGILQQGRIVQEMEASSIDAAGLERAYMAQLTA
ncbi:MAG: ABC transporter ATP-binding protein [Flavobacteriales bacterium]